MGREAGASKEHARSRRLGSPGKAFDQTEEDLRVTELAGEVKASTYSSLRQCNVAR
jgi:hypothetical protein